MTSNTATHSVAATTTEQSGRLLDDRACAQCAMNLRGQPVERDARTRLHLVTCPACGEREALEAYPFAPPLGAMLRPWLAIAWLVVMLGLTTTTVIIVGVSAIEITNGLMRSVDATISTVLTDGMIAEGIARDVAESDRDLRAAYARRVGARHVLDRMGPWPTWFPWWAVVGWAPIGLVFLMIGGVWSILLWGLPLRRRIATMAGLTAITGLLFLSALPPLEPNPYAYVYNAAQVVRPLISWWTYPFVAITIGVLLIVGVAIGRPLARWYVRIMLPPFLGQTLRTLWTNDGRAYPNSRAATPRMESRA